MRVIRIGEGEQDRDLPQRADELDQREEAVARRETALGLREDAPDDRVEAAHVILEAADQRDAEADDRDMVADTRDHDDDRASFLNSDSDADYGDRRPGRRRAALDRGHAKTDRTHSAEDRAHLTEDDVEHDPSPMTDKTPLDMTTTLDYDTVRMWRGFGVCLRFEGCWLLG